MANSPTLPTYFCRYSNTQTPQIHNIGLLTAHNVMRYSESLLCGAAPCKSGRRPPRLTPVAMREPRISTDHRTMSRSSASHSSDGDARFLHRPRSRVQGRCDCRVSRLRDRQRNQSTYKAVCRRTDQPVHAPTAAKSTHV
jgi:hypothetical protein